MRGLRGRRDGGWGCRCGRWVGGWKGWMRKGLWAESDESGAMAFGIS